MDDATKRFYIRIINNAIINAYAVRHGFFDELLCETTDPEVTTRWEAALPQVMELIAMSRRME